MARSIMEVMHENVNPVSVSNALYELMVDWRSINLMMTAATKEGLRKLKRERKFHERTLARFFGVNDHEMRQLLNKHFDIEVNL